MTRSRFGLGIFGLIVGLILGILLTRFSPSHRQPIEPGKSLPDQEESKSIIPGRWREATSSMGERNDRNKLKSEIERLESLGYLAGSRLASRDGGVAVYDIEKAYKGLNLTVSGHAPEAFLMDMSGAILHKWRCEIRGAWPDFKIEDNPGKLLNYTFWRRARLMPNGDLFAIFERIGLIKLDKQSKLLWASRNRAHHDLDIAKNGNIYVLTGQAHVNEEYNSKQPIWEDYISVLDPQGRELKKVSVLKALQNSEYASVVNKAPPAGDLLHTNTIEFIEELPENRPTPFKKGTVLVAILYLDLVCAVDLEEQKVYWAESDFWHREHQPILLANGNILVLDNRRGKDISAVVELNPLSRQVEWSYVGGRDGIFYTETCGSCQRLLNGNTLITESDAGRAFEVTRDKQIVWEYVSPYRTGAQRTLVATLFEIVRMEEDVAAEWLR